MDSSSSSDEFDHSESSRPKLNLKFFDPEEYWCRVCNIFPDNAKEYLHHLHSLEHKSAMAVSFGIVWLIAKYYKILLQEINLIEAAWHDHNPEKPRCEIEGAPERRVPIRGLSILLYILSKSSKFALSGLQFLIAATAWYCKLCHKWMGDLHCTSLHLKSDRHICNVEVSIPRQYWSIIHTGNLVVFQ